MKLFNAFSLQMIKGLNGCDHRIIVEPTDVYNVVDKLQKEGCDSYIGHPDTARILTSILGMEIPCRRVFGTIEPDETVLVARVVGGRLPEGCTKLPNGMRIEFYMVLREDYELN